MTTSATLPKKSPPHVDPSRPFGHLALLAFGVATCLCQGCGPKGEIAADATDTTLPFDAIAKDVRLAHDVTSVVDAGGSGEDAWTTVVTVLLRDPDFVSY